MPAMLFRRKEAETAPTHTERVWDLAVTARRILFPRILLWLGEVWRALELLAKWDLRITQGFICTHLPTVKA